MAKRERILQELKLLVTKPKTIARAIRVPEAMDAEIAEIQKRLGKDATYTDAILTLIQVGIQEVKRKLGDFKD